MLTLQLFALVLAALAVFWFSRLLRAQCLGWGTIDGEARRPMRGDLVVRHPNYQTTLAIEIHARPAEIWPWLVQIGYQRGGLYSYDWLDRLFGYLDRPSSRCVLAEYQQLKPGDVIPIGRGDGFPVVTVVAPEHLLLGGCAGEFAWSWEFAIRPIGTDGSRLVTRNRARMPSTFGWRLFKLVLEPAAFLMTRRMLLGIRERVEDIADRNYLDHLAA